MRYSPIDLRGKSQTTDSKTMTKRHATIDDVDGSTSKPLSKRKRQNVMKVVASGLNNEVSIDNVVKNELNIETNLKFEFRWNSSTMCVPVLISAY